MIKEPWLFADCSCGSKADGRIRAREKFEPAGSRAE